MVLLACGINHQTAPIILREKVAFTPEMMPAPLIDLVQQHKHSQEAAILSTCNRTELYCHHGDMDEIRYWLAQWHKVPHDELSACMYVHEGQQAVEHIMRVAAGLDSQVLGEPQILGQLKAAYQTANEAGTVGRYLGRLFQYVFNVTKQVRSQTAIGESPVSLAFVTVNLAKRIFTDLASNSVLLIGAGETVDLVARYLYEAGVRQFYFANRRIERAQALAAKYSGKGIAISQIGDYIPRADIVVSATASSLPILGKGMVERALKQRRHNPLFLVDLAVPRDIEPEVAELDDVYLYCVDDLHEVISDSFNKRKAAAHEAEQLIVHHAAHFMRNLRSLDAGTMIKSYRDNVEKMRDEILANAQQLLDSGQAPRAVLEKVAHSLANKLMHGPTVKLREASYQGELEMLECAQRLLDIDTQDSSDL